ncbi:MAG TPA: tetratricopeptide repeat protein [Rectinemataceae bacterium]|nr:tetratricopeptide repeat protein [Rectinemataceae bacterium]
MQSVLPIVVVVVVLLAFAIVLVFFVSARKGQPGGKGRKLKTKDKSQIVKEANRRLAANPKDVEALSALGDLAWSEQDWERAFKLYETLAEAGAGNPEVDEFRANSRYAIAAIRLNRFEEAYKGLVVARTIKQDDFDVNFNLGYLEFQRRAFEKALALLKQAMQQNPEHPLMLRYLGHSYFKLKSYKEALGVLRKAIDLQPDDKESLFAAAECYYELGNLDQSLKIFSHLRADPQLGPSAALFAGSVHLNQRLYDRAIDDFEIGLKHQNTKIETMVELKYRLAAAYLKTQDIGKAVSLLGEVQITYPNYKDVPALLAKYKELNSNRNLQTFLLGATSDFVTLCRKISLTFFPKAKVKITDISVQANDWADVLAEVETARWQDVVLFRFIRSQGTVGELAVRDFHARVKDLKAGKGYCISAGTFSDEARRFVEARLIDLIEKQNLMNLLNTIDSRAKGFLAEG